MKSFFSGLIWVLGVLLGVLGVICSFLGAAFILSNIPMLCVIGLVVGFFIIFGMGKLAKHVKGKKTKSHSPIIVASITMLLFSLFCSFTVFKPLPGPIMTGDKPANTKYWKLSTGSNIAYWHYAAEGIKKPTPIIFLHGGPGLFVTDSDKDFCSKFTKEGYDVYLYDQPGAGFSDTLKMDEYTIHRDVEDIEAIRKKIGAEKVIIVGQSFGGVLASSYVTTYPNNVEKIVFTSPAGLSENRIEESKEPRNAGELIKPFKSSFAEEVRLSIIMVLDQVINKQAGENLVSQKEVTDYTTRMTRDALAMAFPPSYVNKIPKIKAGGLNLHSNIAIQSDFKRISADLRNKIKKVNIPVLILRSEYDYIPWGNTREYRELYPNSKLVYIKDAGHDIWAVNEKDSYNTIRAFILNEKLPLPNYEGKEMPGTVK